MVRRRLDRRGVDAVGPGGALLDPPRQHVDLLGREAVALALGRHDFLGVIAADEVDELALFGLARRNRLVARVAAGPDELYVRRRPKGRVPWRNLKYT